MFPNVGLLIFRVGLSIFMAFPHGLQKLIKFSHLKNVFPDPLGIGHLASLCGAIFGEFFCPLFIIVGFKVRWFSVPPAITMLVAGLIVHFKDPFAKKELALLYALGFITLTLVGGGKFSFDKDKI